MKMTLHRNTNYSHVHCKQTAYKPYNNALTKSSRSAKLVVTYQSYPAIYGCTYVKHC